MQLNTQVPSACANLWHDASDRDGTRAGTGVGASSNSRCISSYVRFLFESKRMYSSIICSPSEFFCGRAFISQLQINSTHSSGHHKKGSAAKWRTVNTTFHPHTHTHPLCKRMHSHTVRQAGRHTHTQLVGITFLSWANWVLSIFEFSTKSGSGWLWLAEAEALTLLSLRVSKASYHYSYTCSCCCCFCIHLLLLSPIQCRFFGRWFASFSHLQMFFLSL